MRDRETPEMRERETRKRDMRQEREMWYLAERGISQRDTTHERIADQETRDGRRER